MKLASVSVLKAEDTRIILAIEEHSSWLVSKAGLSFSVLSCVECVTVKMMTPAVLSMSAKLASETPCMICTGTCIQPQHDSDSECCNGICNNGVAFLKKKKINSPDYD